MSTKVCEYCNKEKPLDGFYKEKDDKCRSCKIRKKKDNDKDEIQDAVNRPLDERADVLVNFNSDVLDMLAEISRKLDNLEITIVQEENVSKYRRFSRK